MRSIYVVAAVAFCALSTSNCARTVTTAPKELVDARMTYGRLTGTQAQKLVPAQLHIAHRALEDAEKAFVEHPDSLHTRDIAYIAMRKAQVAELGAQAAAFKADAKEVRKENTSDVVQATEKKRIEVEAAQRELEAVKAANKDVNRTTDDLKSKKQKKE